MYHILRESGQSFYSRFSGQKEHLNPSKCPNFHFSIVTGRLDKYSVVLACIHTLREFDNTYFSLLPDHVYFYYPG